MFTVTIGNPTTVTHDPHCLTCRMIFFSIPLINSSISVRPSREQFGTLGCLGTEHLILLWLRCPASLATVELANLEDNTDE